MADSTNEPYNYECPVCLQILIPPIYQCCNGHLICRTCLPKLDTCPVCREKLPEKQIRNLEIEKIVKVQKLPCPNKQSGCTAVLTHGLIEDHRIDCLYSVQNFCPFLGITSCAEGTSSNDFVVHLMESHRIVGEFVPQGTSIEICQSGAVLRDIEGGKVCWAPNFIVQGDNTFFLRTNLTTYGISWMISVLGNTEVQNQFRASIELVSPDDDQSTSRVWRGPVCSFKSKFEDNPSVFSIPFPEMRLFWNKEADQVSLKLQVCIERRGDPTLGNTEHVVINSVAEPSSFVEAGASHGADELIIHEDVECDGCNFMPLVGPRYKCIQCPNYDLCKDCVEKNLHSHHLFLRASGSDMRETLEQAHERFGVEATTSVEHRRDDELVPERPEDAALRLLASFMPVAGLVQRGIEVYRRNN